MVIHLYRSAERLFSLLACCHLPNSHIYTYEPNPRIFEQLSENLSPIQGQVRSVGVSCKLRRAEMKDTKGSRMAATTLKEDGELELISLSQIVKDVGGKIDLLKMACEGAEWDISEDKAAFQTINTIRMEYHLDEFHTVESLNGVTDNFG